MSENDLYTRVCRVCPIDKARFDKDFLWARSELCAMFGEKYVLDAAGIGETDVREEYATAIASAVLFCETGDAAERERFLTRGKGAFLTVWKEKARGRKRGKT